MARTRTGSAPYYQYQVILKPSPPDLQQLYLGSLAAIGIDFTLHDIRFVEDDWESPTLGAWGLGWEVWCDGMEVTQFTYFQQMGGFDCKPVAGELTYGLERLAMYVQNKDSVYDLDFNDRGVTYGDVFLENERQMSPAISRSPTPTACSTASARPPPNARTASSANCPSPPTNRRSRPATSSTRCRPAASSPSPNARPISAASATSPKAPARLDGQARVGGVSDPHPNLSRAGRAGQRFFPSPARGRAG
jgi:hypothetical protein